MFFSIIQKRRSIRKFKPVKISPETIGAIIEAGIRAPSSRGLRPWNFIVVEDPELLRSLAASKEYGSGFLAEAPLAIVVVADPERSDVWIEDTSIAATYIQLAAESLDLGSCWIQIRERMHNPESTAEEFVRQILHIPDRYRVPFILAIGIPDQRLAPHRFEDLDDHCVSFNGWGEK
jgi:nitroreductase